MRNRLNQLGLAQIPGYVSPEYGSSETRSGGYGGDIFDGGGGSGGSLLWDAHIFDSPIGSGTANVPVTPIGPVTPVVPKSPAVPVSTPGQPSASPQPAMPTAVPASILATEVSSETALYIGLGIAGLALILIFSGGSK